jgi:hypothetical protein
MGMVSIRFGILLGKKKVTLAHWHIHMYMPCDYQSNLYSKFSFIWKIFVRYGEQGTNSVWL